MAARLEIATKPELSDPLGASVARKAVEYFGLPVGRVRVVRVLTIDAPLSEQELEALRVEVFTNPVTDFSSFKPLPIPGEWVIWVGFLPGVKDAAGETAAEVIEDFLGRRLPAGSGCYTSRLYFIESRAPRAATEGGQAPGTAMEGRHAGAGSDWGLKAADVERIAAELLANDLIQQWRIWQKDSSGAPMPARGEVWDPDSGMGIIVPKVHIEHRPTVSTIPVGSDRDLLEISEKRGLFLDPRDVPAIRAYFSDPAVRRARRALGLGDPTDVELEYIAQARSDHCNHNTFRGLFEYVDEGTGERIVIDNLFKTCIADPTRMIARRKPWVMSVLWDNGGVARFDEDNLYTITCETHNSPSNMEAYGGALTGIVGVYRDPMGTGKGSRLIAGTFGFCTAERSYDGPLKPRLHPRRLLDGIIEGVRDGGNKSGIPTVFGSLYFDRGFLGKCLVFVGAVGMMPAESAGSPNHEKHTSPGDLLVMCGGRVGKDGIHGVTASSGIYSSSTPAGHVQIGDPYVQKKMHDFLIEAREAGLIKFITDCGGGGLSSAVGESARFSGGVHVDLEKVPLKYDGLDQWEIWVSESQERMIVAVEENRVEEFIELSRKHAVESTVIGHYTDTGFVHLEYEGQTCCHLPLNFFERGFPQWRFEAVWRSPASRGLTEPALSEPERYGDLLLEMLARPNIASHEWVYRQYDHEVQGTSVVKPLVGRKVPVPADAAVLRPLLDSRRCLAITHVANPRYSAIDTYHMTTAVVDEAVRRILAAGGDPEQIGGLDNFCWPEIRFDRKRNPDGKYKAAQLVRSALALKSAILAYGIPLLSGKDSMYVDGDLEGPFGERRRVSALPTLQFTASGIILDLAHVLTLEPKCEGDYLYILGTTGDELGGSEYYALLGYLGANVPVTDLDGNLPRYRAFAGTVRAGLVRSAHALGRGGLGAAAALMVISSGLGLSIDLSAIPQRGGGSRLSADRLLFSESTGRLLVTVDPVRAQRFEEAIKPFEVARIGRVIPEWRLSILWGADGVLAELEGAELARAWTSPFGDLI